jgi:hypothetical protein
MAHPPNCQQQSSQERNYFAREMVVLNATLAATGALSVAVGGKPWFSSGPVAFINNGQWFASDCNAMAAPDLCISLTSYVALFLRCDLHSTRSRSTKLYGAIALL